MRDQRRPLVFGVPVVTDEDIDAVSSCLRSGWIGTGPRAHEFAEAFAAYKQARYALPVSSCTAALHLAYAVIGAGPGDEIIAPTMTFASTVTSIMHVGARPVLVDCEPNSRNIDPARVEERITPRTKAIVVVHIGGRPVDMAPILKIARRHGLYLIEDCAHAIESVYGGRPAGTIGNIGCFSFYPTKNLTTGDGGMLLTSNKRLFQRASQLSYHGMDSDAWSRIQGGIRQYRVLTAGFKYNMTDITAAFGLSQLKSLPARWQRRRELWNLYQQELATTSLLLPRECPPSSRHACHLYSPLLPAHIRRDEFRAALLAEGIGTGVHYIPIHRHPFYFKRYPTGPTAFPNANRVGRLTISLPFSAGLDDQDARDVCFAVKRILSWMEECNQGRSPSRT